MDYTSCDDAGIQGNPSISDKSALNGDGTESLQQSTMTNSESPSPKKDENNHEYSFSAASEDEADFNNIEVNNVLIDLKGPSRSKTQYEDDTLGKKLIDRKRLRIFANITKKKTVDISK